MTPILPPVLGAAYLPAPELNAARLDGEVFALDECFCPIDEVEQSIHRARALAAILPAKLIAEQRTAAWVFGVLEQPPARHQVCADIDARTRPPSVRISVREVVLADGDVLNLGGMRLTTPLRTTVDLARFSPAFAGDEFAIIRALAALGHFGLVECAAMLERGRNLPAKRLALRRLRCALG